MAVPQFDVVVDGIVSVFQAASGFSAPGGAGVPVFDGPVITGEPLQAWAAVGWDGDDESVGDVITFDQAWHSFGGATSPDRDDTVTVSCVLVVGDGGSDFSSLRTSASTYLGALSDALRTTYTLGAAQVLWSELSSGGVAQGVSTQGAFVRVAFTVSVRCLI